MDLKLTVFLTVAFCAFLGALGQVFFKLASKNLNLEIVSIITNWKLMIGLLFYAIATILFVFALKQANLSILYPIIATSYIWVAIFSTVFLKEPFPAYKWAGIFILILAIGIITK